MNSPSISEPETETVTCEHHGAYVAKVTRIPGFVDRPIRSECPACREQREREEEAHKLAYERRVQEMARAGRLASCRIPPRFADKTLADFVPTSEGARKAKALAERYVAAFGTARGTSLIFCGKPGTGKTHLACAIAHAVTEKLSARFCSVLAAIRHVKSAYRKDCEYTEEEAIGDLIAPALLVLDEVGVQVGSEHEKMLLFEIINERYQQCRSTILVSNLTAEEIAEYLGDRVVDRFREDGAIVAFDWASYRTRRPS